MADIELAYVEGLHKKLDTKRAQMAHDRLRIQGLEKRVDALVEALREIAAGAVPDYGSDPDYRTRGEMGNIASVALAFLTDEEQADG
jgi:hypothetical protein